MQATSMEHDFDAFISASKEERAKVALSRALAHESRQALGKRDAHTSAALAVAAVGAGDTSEGSGALLGTASGEIWIWNPASGEQRLIRTVGQPLESLDWVIAGRSVVAKTSRVVEVIDLRRVASLNAGSERFFSPMFRRLGRAVVGHRVAAVINGKTTVFDLDRTTLVRRACAVAGKRLSPAEWARVAGDLPYQRVCDEQDAGR
jgi:hypothetical protein